MRFVHAVVVCKFMHTYDTLLLFLDTLLLFLGSGGSGTNESQQTLQSLKQPLVPDSSVLSGDPSMRSSRFATANCKLLQCLYDRMLCGVISTDNRMGPYLAIPALGLSSPATHKYAMLVVASAMKLENACGHATVRHVQTSPESGVSMLYGRDTH
mmetsp:Transcript_4398/g.9689  ORF Transcript_4398/g.9689 Transcript_4398/m.9689 type:complete len:155 (-) Transcript_4398:488-952(-)